VIVEENTKESSRKLGEKVIFQMKPHHISIPHTNMKSLIATYYKYSLT